MLAKTLGHTRVLPGKDTTQSNLRVRCINRSAYLRSLGVGQLSRSQFTPRDLDKQWGRWSSRRMTSVHPTDCTAPGNTGDGFWKRYSFDNLERHL